MDNRKVCIMVLLDFSSAFNLVNFDILLAKLSKQFNFSNDATNLIKSYLTGRKQCVIVGNKKSD
jgi:hypothetical protein